MFDNGNDTLSTPITLRGITLRGRRWSSAAALAYVGGDRRLLSQSFAIFFALLVIVFCSATPAQALIDLSRVLPGTFAEIPNTKIDAVLPSPLPPVGMGSAEAIVTGWGSGAWDPKRQRLYVLGGGHFDYSGNEVYAFDLKTQTVVRLTDPSLAGAVPLPPTAASDAYVDGRPTSIHPYGAVQYIASLDALWVGGGSRWYDGAPSATGWLLDLTTLKWRALAGHFPRKLGISSAVDPQTGIVWLRGDQNYGSWNPATPDTPVAWGALDNVGTYDGHVSAVGGRSLITLGVINGPGSRSLIWHNLDTGQTADFLPFMSGDTEIFGMYAPGVDFDGTNWMAYAGGSAIYEINLGGGKVTKHVIPGPAPPSQNPNGTFGRWRYVASLGGFLYVGSIHENVWFYRSGTAAPVPAPPRAPTPVPPEPLVPDPVPPAPPAPPPAPAPSPAPPSPSAPTVTALAPASGPTLGGTWVEITGTGFSGATAVRFGGVAAGSMTIESATQIRASAPGASPGTADVTVTTPLGTSAPSDGARYTYWVSPVPPPPPAPVPPPPPAPVPPPAPAPPPPPPAPVPPPPGSPTQWRSLPLPAPGQGPMPYGGKHSRLTWDSARHRLVFFGGDIARYTDDGSNEMWAGLEGAWTRLAGFCAANAGDIVPARPDNVTWVYASKPDRYVVMPGFFFGTAAYQRYCGTAGVPLQKGLAFNPTTLQWEDSIPVPPWGYGGDTGANFGFYDPVANAIGRLRWDGTWGAVYERVLLDTGVWSKVNLGAAPQDGGPPNGVYNGDVRNMGVTTSKSVVDATGRYAYSLAMSSAATWNPLPWGLLRVNLDTGLSDIVWVPQNIGFVVPAAEGGGGTDVLLAFDPVHRVIIHPMIPNLGGEVLGILIYHVDTGVWETDLNLPTSPPYVLGNVVGFDEDAGELVLMGGHSIASVLRPGTTLPDPTVSWRYRYNGGLSLAFSPSQSASTSGDILHLDLTFANAGEATNVDVYFGVRLPAAAGPEFGCPGGDAIVFVADNFAQSVTTCLSAPPRDFAPLVTNLPLAASIPATLVQDFFTVAWPPGAPAGAYTFVLTLTSPGTLDVIGLAQTTVSFSP